MSDTPDIFSVMTVHALDVSTATAERIARERWGIAGTARALTGERDRNFHLRATDGREFVLKFANPAEDAGVTDMQIKALRHLEQVDPGLAVPRIIPLPDGSVETPVPHETGGIQRVRLLSWIPGVSLRDSRRGPAQRVACGQALARVQLGLRDFTHPSAGHALIWDMQHILRLREVAGIITHQAGRRAIDSVLDEFEARVTPVLGQLRRQVLYNDMNGPNTLVDPANHDRFVGLIDFGDMVETAVVIDVATGGPSQLGADMSPARALGLYAAGFHAIRPLLDEEVALLPLLIAARVVMGTILQAWHRHIQPHNPHYEDLTTGDIEHRVALIAAIRAPETDQALRRACGRVGG